jgi:ribonuclease III
MLTDTQIAEIESAINQQFNNKDLLRQVFIHRSYLNENPGCPIGHNERLEFLGDAVLELIVTEYLYQNYPNPEGELTAWRSALVRGQHLAEVAANLNLGEWLLLSRGESKSGGKTRQILLANMFEALLGAMYLDSGLETVRQFVHNQIVNNLERILAQELHIDAKSKLQEVTQARVGITPHYAVLKEDGPDHAKEFTVGVFLGQNKLAEAKGSSKQTAEQAAATLGIVNFLKTTVT